MTAKFSQAVSTSVFRGVSDADCLRQAEAEGAVARTRGYEPLSQEWSDDAGLRVLRVVYRYSGGPAFGPTGTSSGAAPQASDWQAPSRGNGLPGIVRLLLAAGGILLLLSAIGSFARTPATGGSAGATRPAVGAWWPTGFSAWASDSNVAYRWFPDGSVSCTYSGGRCWSIEVVTLVGCPNSLYGEVSLADQAGTAIGYTNDVAGAVTPFQHAKLLFDTLDSKARTARLAKISCY